MDPYAPHMPMMDPYGAPHMVPMVMVDPMGYPYGIPTGMYVTPSFGPPVPMHMPPLMMPPVMAPLNPFHLNLHSLEVSPRGEVKDSNLFVFHLPPETDDQALESMFSEYGSIESAKVMMDKATGESKGYGFVLFTHLADAERALAMNGRCMGSKRLSVSFKTHSPRERTPPLSPMHPPGYQSLSPRHNGYPSPLHSPRTTYTRGSPLHDHH